MFFGVYPNLWGFESHVPNCRSTSCGFFRCVQSQESEVQLGTTAPDNGENMPLISKIIISNRNNHLITNGYGFGIGLPILALKQPSSKLPNRTSWRFSAIFPAVSAPHLICYCTKAAANLPRLDLFLFGVSAFWPI
jgi:hypothetical protein